ncbi:MAG: tetratricopeptide repeat protein [Chloroflexi bacterium]|nr:tetratricopeptide repeat protein [Chloroflexota bacterium]
MMFRAHLFGTFTLLDGARGVPLPAARARALLAYLLLHRAQPHPRAVFVGIFFPDLSEPRARRALSQALWHIRRALPRLIQADAETIQVSRDASIWVDVEEFRKISDFRFQISDLSSPSPSSNLQSLISLYRGDLLEGFYDDWLLLERERLREMYLQALEWLVQAHKSTQQYADALDAALKLTLADPLRESAHREVMRLYFLLQRPDAALKQFATCRQILKTELALEPEPETLALAREIAQRGSRSPAPYLPPTLPVSPGLDAAQLPLIGRADARAQLLAHVESLHAGGGGIALIEGEAGVGKTRLAQEIARDAEWRGAHVLWGHCQERDAAAPYAPVTDALAQGLSPLRVEQLRGLLDPIWQQTLAPLLPHLAITVTPPAPLDPKSARARLIDALAQLIAAWTQITPLVVIVEDLHWADDATLDLLAQLASRLRETRALFIGTYRGEDARAQTTRWEKMQSLDRAGLRGQLELKRLDPTATQELIRRALGLARAAPRFEERLYRETDGNPLFVLETLRTLRDEGLLARDAVGQWRTPWDETTRDYAEVPLPRVVERVIARRATQLGAPAQHILRAAAILGGDLDFALARAVGELETQQTLSALGELVQRRFLEETRDAYRFTHDKVRQVIYASIAEPERRVLHQRAAQALEHAHPDRLDALAHHFFAAEEWHAAAQYAQRAGEQAARVYAHRDAAAQFTRALDALARTRDASSLERFEAYAARERAYDQLGDRRAQADDLDALEASLDDPALATPSRRAQIALRRASYLDALTDYPAALTAIARAVELARDAADAEIEFQARVRWGRMLRQRGEYAEARAQFDHAFALAQQQNDSLAQATVLNDLGVIAFNSGNFNEALTNCQRALELARGDPKTSANIHNSLGIFYHYTADYIASLAHYDQVLAWRRASGDRLNEASCLYNLAVVQSDRGEHTLARRALEEVAEITRAIGERRIEGYAVVFLGVVFEHLNDLDAAEDAYTRGLALRRAIGLDALAIDPLAGLARVATARGDHARARQYADEVLAWLTTRGIAGVGDALLAYVGAYRALLAAGETARGMTALQTAYDLLMTQAATIPDEERRRAFIHDISPGKHIWNDYHTRVETARPRIARVRLPRADAPTGRALRDDEYIEIVWTLAATEDDAIADKVERRQHRLARLLAEARAQGAAPTHAQLANALGVGVRTVERDVGRMRAEG